MRWRGALKDDGCFGRFVACVFATCLTSGDLINPHYCGTESQNDFRDFSISDAFPWAPVANKSKDLSERSNRRAVAVACEEVCSETPPDTGDYYLDWHRLLRLISADMRRPEQLQEVLSPSHTLINKYTHTLVSNTAIKARSPAQWRIAFSKKCSPVSCRTQTHTQVIFPTLVRCPPRQHFQE